MKARPYRFDGKTYHPCEANEATHVELNCPGPHWYRLLPVVQGSTPRHGTPCWTWNGNTEQPTLKPSIRTNGGCYVDGAYSKVLCHSFVTDGKIKFLNDCTHEFKGQTVDLLEVE